MKFEHVHSTKEIRYIYDNTPIGFPSRRFWIAILVSTTIGHPLVLEDECVEDWTNESLVDLGRILLLRAREASWDD